MHCENWRKRVTADRDGKWNRLFLGRRWAKNPRSVKIRQKNRKLLVKRKLFRWISLARRARIIINEKGVRVGAGRRGKEGGRRNKNDGGFWAAKAQKSVNDRFYVCLPDTRSCTHLHRRRPNRQFVEAWKSTTAFFVLCNVLNCATIRSETPFPLRLRYVCI